MLFISSNVKCHEQSINYNFPSFSSNLLLQFLSLSYLLSFTYLLSSLSFTFSTFFKNFSSDLSLHIRYHILEFSLFCFSTSFSFSSSSSSSTSSSLLLLLLLLLLLQLFVFYLAVLSIFQFFFLFLFCQKSGECHKIKQSDTPENTDNQSFEATH